MSLAQLRVAVDEVIEEWKYWQDDAMIPTRLSQAISRLSKQRQRDIQKHRERHEAKNL